MATNPDQAQQENEEVQPTAAEDEEEEEVDSLFSVEAKDGNFLTSDV